ncbi:cysteine hydrolase family protein [Synechococcus sp. ATX 2A4]|uniref:cysteine hydrolase family protein n=1 Tax=Synechococcus sp. ATX 2A4 TaxID=2823727 RepID=UPI0020CDDCA1|nr:isochorismatase family cysteine hydrolase [Synechococcus sp. ATX 2A4]
MTNTALIAIDFINDIADPCGLIAASAAHAEARGTLHNAATALREAGRLGWLRVGVRVGFHSDEEMPVSSPLFRRLRGTSALRLGAWGTSWHALLGDPHFDLEVIKSRVSCFARTPLETHLRDDAIQRVVICGISSAVAVESAVRDAHDLDFEVSVIEDACAAIDEATHQQAMEHCRLFGKLLLSTDLEAYLPSK